MSDFLESLLARSVDQKLDVAVQPRPLSIYEPWPGVDRPGARPGAVDSAALDLPVAYSEDRSIAGQTPPASNRPDRVVQPGRSQALLPDLQPPGAVVPLSTGYSPPAVLPRAATPNDMAPSALAVPRREEPSLPGQGVGNIPFIQPVVETIAPPEQSRHPSHPAGHLMQPVDSFSEPADDSQVQTVTQSSLAPPHVVEQGSQSTQPPRSLSQAPIQPLERPDTIQAAENSPPLPPSRRAELPPLASNAQAQPAAPAIQVTIGRIEVRAIPATSPVPQARKSTPHMTLEEYLRLRDGGQK